MTHRSAGDPAGAGSLQPVARGGLTERVIEALRERIGAGTWALHQRIPVEATLAKELGVGRSTIREAVRVLVHAGLLEVRQGSGTYVRARHEIDAAMRRRVTGANLLEAFEVRRALEMEIARLAARRATRDDVTALRALAATRAQVYWQGSAEYRTADLAFRERLLDTARNPLLADLYRGVVHPLRAALPAHVDDAELTRDDPDEPETPRLLDALADGDPERAAAIAATRLDRAAAVLRFVLFVAVVDPPTRP